MFASCHACWVSLLGDTANGYFGVDLRQVLIAGSGQDKRAEQMVSGDGLLRFDAGIWWTHDQYKEAALRAAGLLNTRRKTILDFGCGPGTLGAILARNNTVIGIDLAAQAVRAAVSRARKDGTDFIGVIMDGETQGFARAVFDVELSGWALHHFPILDVPLRQLRESLKVGGKLVLIEPNESGFPQRISRAVEDVFRAVVLSAGLDTPNRTTHTRKEYVEMLKRLGFRIEDAFSTYSGERPEIPRSSGVLKKLALSVVLFARRLLFDAGSSLGSGPELVIVATKV